jgi:predicted HTH domain antitoxin
MDALYQLTIDLPSSVKEKLPDLEQEAKRLIAMKVYQNGGVSVGYAAEIAGMDKFDFEFLLADNHIAIRGPTFEQVKEDARKLHEMRMAEKQANKKSVSA